MQEFSESLGRFWGGGVGSIGLFLGFWGGSELSLEILVESLESMS